MDSVAEAMWRALVTQEIASAMPTEVVTDWEAGYARGLQKAIQIVEDRK